MPASNTVEIVSTHSVHKNLGLVGRYVYICYKINRDRTASMHLDYLMRDGNSCRLTLTTLTNQPRAKEDNNPMLPLENTGKWTILVIDIHSTFTVLKAYPKTNLFRKYNYELHSITLCADAYVRGIYTSNNLYNLSVMPKEINYRKPEKGQWTDVYNIRYFPPQCEQESTKFIQHHQQEFLNSRKPFTEQGRDIGSIAEIGPEESPAPQEVGILERTVLFKENLEEEHKNAPNLSSVISPNPILTLDRVVGFTGRTCPDIKFSKTEADGIYYASGNMIIQSSVSNFGTQKFLQGHKTAITCLDLSADGRILASCQEGENPVLRFWSTATGDQIGKFTVFVVEARCISFACKGYTLCVIGTDKLGRDQILIIEAYVKPDNTLGARIIAQQTSEFNILTIKFSPTESDRLVSCGKQNIRFWRIKNKHLPGGAVVLHHHARDTVFTVFDFDFGKSDQPGVANRDDVVKRVLVGSKHGCIYYVNYDTRKLENVLKIHELSICSISVNAGFCVTGSQDQYLRVWPLDFSEFFIEFQHEGIIISLDVSLDGLKVACGTSDNSISVLELTNQSYKTLFRSHSDTITSLKYQQDSNVLLSLSKDSTIRIWDANTLDQIYEFTYRKEDECLSIDFHPRERFFVGGFSSGMFRVFSIDKIEVVSEHKFHNQPIEDIKYSPTGKLIGLGDAKGFYSIINSNNNYEFVKTFEPELNNNKICCDFTPDEKFFATIGALNSCVNLWSLETLSKHYTVPVKGSFIHTFKFSQGSQFELFILTCDSKIKVYGLEKRKAFLAREQINTHQNFVSDMAFLGQSNYIVTAGGDKHLCVWDYWMRIKKSPENHQEFKGHACPIYSVVATKDGTVYSAGGSEGIFCWKCRGDLFPLSLGASSSSPVAGVAGANPFSNEDVNFL